MNTMLKANGRTSPASGSHSIFRTVGAVVAALATWIFVATVLNLILRASWPEYRTAEIAFEFNLGMKLARLVLGAVSSLSAGFVATWITNGKMKAAAFTGIVLLALFIPDHYLIWNKFPVWYHLTFLVTLLPLILLGGALTQHTRNKAEPALTP